IPDILDRHPNSGPDHQQPDSGTDRKARTCGRDQGCCAASAHPGDLARFVLPIRTCRRLDGRGSATCENLPTAAASPTIPVAFCTSLIGTTGPRYTPTSLKLFPMA